MVLPHEGQTFLMCSTDSHADLLPKCSTYVCTRTHAHCFTSYLGSFHLVKPMYLNTPAQIWKGSDGDDILLLSLTPRETFCPFRMKQPWTLRMKSPASPGLLSVVKHSEAQAQSMCSSRLCLRFLIPSAYQLLSLLFLPNMMSLLQGILSLPS